MLFQQVSFLGIVKIHEVDYQLTNMYIDVFLRQNIFLSYALIYSKKYKKSHTKVDGK